MRKRYVDKSVMYLVTLLEMYEDYIWKNDGTRLEVMFQDKQIFFKLYDDKEVIDDISLSFEDREDELYKYIALRIFVTLFGKVMIHNDGDVFYNDVHKSYLRLIAGDMELKEMMIKVKEKQMSEFVNAEMSLVKEIYSQVPKRLSTGRFTRKLRNWVYTSGQILRGEVK